jgi:hypothetical protein
MIIAVRGGVTSLEKAQVDLVVCDGPSGTTRASAAARRTLTLPYGRAIPRLTNQGNCQELS